MSWSRKIDIIDSYDCSPLVVRHTSIVEPWLLRFPSFVEDIDDLGLPLDLVNPSSLDLFDNLMDLVRVEKSPSSRTSQKFQKKSEPELPPQKYLCDRVYALERQFERLLSPNSDDCNRKFKLTKETKGSGERKYKWEAEIEGPPDRKYRWEAEINGSTAERKYMWEAKIEGPAERKHKWTAEVKGEKKDEERELVVEKEKVPEKKKKNYKWTEEIKSENGAVSRTYTIKASNGGQTENPEKEKWEKKSKKKEKPQVVVIEEEDEPENRGAVVLRKVFAKRAGAVKSKKGKNKELSYEEAAMIIQRTFRAYLIRRSKTLRALRELAVAKTKLKEIRSSFQNFSYRRFIGRDPEERQKFSERIIVLLLTVDAIQGVDVMVRRAKKSMIDELEAMLEVVDPQPAGKSLSMKRRTFDMPDSVISREIADGVTQIVQMLETRE